MRSFLRVLSLAVVLVGTFSLPASEASRDLAVIQAALDHHFSSTFIYVDRWVVADMTEPLEAGDSDLANATCRAGEPLELAAIQHRTNVKVSALGEFFVDGKFDWVAFEQAFGSGTWIAHVGRPCFLDEANAVIRVDVSAKNKQGRLTSVIGVTGGRDGSWVVKTSRSR